MWWRRFRLHWLRDRLLPVGIVRDVRVCAAALCCPSNTCALLLGGVRDRIGAAARANNRTMTSEIIACLEQKFGPESGQSDERSKLAAERILAWPSGSGELEARLQRLEQQVD